MLAEVLNRFPKKVVLNEMLVLVRLLFETSTRSKEISLKSAL